MERARKTHELNDAVRNLDFAKAMELRGKHFQESFRILRTLIRSTPHPLVPGKERIRFAIINASGPAPGMNAAVRAVVRIAVDRGHIPVGVYRGMRGD